MAVYYNEHDPKAAAWLRALISEGLIAPGEVDERSIEDVQPDELLGYAQCHFFAGIGGWSLALRLAGWPDDRPVWTGSCPCQPFSAAGQGAGADDERHLWPSWHWLIDQCRPPIVVGEQVASKDGRHWWDAVRSDLEASQYAAAAADLCAASVGAPHIRQRLWIVGVGQPDRNRREAGQSPAEVARYGRSAGPNGSADQLADPGRQRDELGRDAGQLERSADQKQSQTRERERRGDADRNGGATIRVDHAAGARQQPEGERPEGETRNETRLRRFERGRGADQLADPGTSGLPDREPRNVRAEGRGEERRATSERSFSLAQPEPFASALDGQWRDADWLLCTDGKWRPVEPGSFPLAHGVSDRVGLLRGYGNAIVPQVAQAWIEAVMAEIGVEPDADTAAWAQAVYTLAA